MHLVDKLTEECSENIIYDTTLNDHKKVCNSGTIYRVLFVIFVKISINSSSAFIYFHWYLKESNTYVNTSTNNNIKIGTTIY